MSVRAYLRVPICARLPPCAYLRASLCATISLSISSSLTACLTYRLSVTLAHSSAVALLRALPSHLRACCNPEHHLDQEIGDKSLAEMPFTLAMRLDTCKGTISVVDEEGKSFGRIWCGN